MKSMEEKILKLEYYQKLLLEMIGDNKFPFHTLVMKRELSKEEVEETFALCEYLSKEYEEQVESGFIYFDKLLTQFAGMLNPKLDMQTTIDALYEQELFKPLMEKLKVLLHSKKV